MTILTADEIRSMRASNILAGARLFWDLADEVCAIYGVQVSELTAKNRGSLLANEARKRLCRAALDRGLSSAQVGKWLGGRDHTTVLYAAKSVGDMAVRIEEAPLVFHSRRG